MHFFINIIEFYSTFEGYIHAYETYHYKSVAKHRMTDLVCFIVTFD